MLKLYAVELENFKCYYGTHHFEFPQEPGLYYLTGRNDFNSRLGANATGKSTLVESINWCLYGKTSRGLKASDVVAWKKKSCRVAVTLLIDVDEIEIVRTQSPNTLTINGNPASQDEVTKLLRLNMEAFNCSVILPQFGESFFDLTPTRKLEMFSEVMNLDFWLEKSKLASTKAERTDDAITEFEKEIYVVRSKLESLKENVKEYRKKSDEFEDEIKAEIKSLANEVRIQRKLGDLARKDIKHFIRQIENKEVDLKEIKDGLNEAAEEFTQLHDSHSTYVTEHKTVLRHVFELRDEYQKLKAQKGTICPECKQPIDDTHIKTNKERILKQQAKLEIEADRLLKKINSIEGKLNAARTDTNELNRLKQTYENDFDQLKNAKREAESLNKESISTIDSLTDRIKKTKQKENPFKEMLVKANQEKIKLKGALIHHEEEMNNLLVKLEQYKFWINGFKRVRLYVVKEALTSLEVEVNNLLISLGLIDWRVTFDVEHENKSGSVSKGFSVFIHSPKHDKPVRFEAWSGGETQRLRLAGDLGLANLIMEQAGYTNHIEIIDEPSEHMSPEGIEDLLETIHQRAHDTGKQIWLVDHNTMEFSGFSGTLTAVMSEKGKAHLEYKG